MTPTEPTLPLPTIAVLTIIVTAFLILAYYIFLINKCWSNDDQLNHLNGWLFTGLRSRQEGEDSFIALSPSTWINRGGGVDEVVMREIPSFQYRRKEEKSNVDASCVVCLNEFHGEDMVRVLPNCNHTFHLDCIDIWLQNNENCPLCRTSILGKANGTKLPLDCIVAPTSSPQYSTSDSPRGRGDEDFVVIELGREENDEAVLLRTEQVPSRQVTRSRLLFLSPMKKKSLHVSIQGDECINVRVKDDHIQPIRRSFSLDSAADRQLYSNVQSIIRQREDHINLNVAGTSTRVQSSFFQFSRKASVLPVGFDF